MTTEKRIVVGLELVDSERDRAVLRAAREFFGKDRPLLLLHSHQIRQTAVLEFVKTESPERLTTEITRAETKLRALADEAGGPIEIEVAIGHPPEVILERAKSAAAVVIARTERSLVDRVLEGSVEGKLVSSTPCPLLIVP